MAWPFSKPLADLTHEDLGELLGVPESDWIEYKRDAYGRNDEQTREMLRDISSFANATGGYLLLGVATDAEERASEIVGIPDADTEAARMLSSCRANIQEWISGLTFQLVPVSDSKKVLIGISRGVLAPRT
jgi:predicted HTH transcriptional regulator